MRILQLHFALLHTPDKQRAAVVERVASTLSDPQTAIRAVRPLAVSKSTGAPAATNAAMVSLRAETDACAMMVSHDSRLSWTGS